MNTVISNFWAIILTDMFNNGDGIFIDYTYGKVYNWDDFEIAANHYNFVKKYYVW
jgi:hypothetical protein